MEQLNDSSWIDVKNKKECIKNKCCNKYSFSNEVSLSKTEIRLIKNSKEDIYCYCCTNRTISKIIGRTFSKCNDCNCCREVYEDYSS